MIKLLIDRKSPSKSTIQKRQNFEEILNKLPKKSPFVSPWFYGAIGFSSVLFFIILSFSR